MCGRYQIDANGDTIEERYGHKMPTSFKPRFNISPAQDMPIVLEDRIEMMKWGLPLKFGEKFIRNLANVRDDSLVKSWAKRYLAQRCLIPTTGYYEWKKTSNGKIPFYFGLRDHSLFSFAGLYEDGEYAIITTSPNKEAAKVHDRMPTILTKDQEKDWLNPDNVDLEYIQEFVKPYGHKLEMYPISTRINIASNEGPDVVEPN